MVIALFGESCTGKSTLAQALSAPLNAKIYTGRDYLRLNKQEAEARKAFAAILTDETKNSIFVLAEPALLSLVPQSAYRVLVTAELSVIKERFAARTGGTLPPPIAAMLERKHGQFDKEAHDFAVRSDAMRSEEAAAAILAACRDRFQL